MKPMLSLLLLNLATGLCGYLTLRYAEGPYAMVFGMFLSVGLFCDVAYLLSYRRNDPPVRDLEQRVSRPVPTRSFAHAKHVPDRQAHTAQLRRIR